MDWALRLAMVVATAINVAGIICSLRDRRRFQRKLAELAKLQEQCSHDWKKQKVSHNEMNQTFVLCRCAKCGETTSGIYYGKWTMDDLDAPTAEELTKLYGKPDSHLGATES